MNNFTCTQHYRDELSNSQSSDDKMDTGSESFKSQGTPNSNSSDFDDREEVLRLQNPDVLRLSEPVYNRISEKSDLSDSFVSKMSQMNISTPENRPKNLKIGIPKLSSTLTLTTNHPLMGLGSPDENYPDLIPKKMHKVEEKDLSFSSIEGDKTGEINGYEFYSPQRNTSKSNLYISDNYVTADSQILNDSLNYSNASRRKIIPRLSESPGLDTSVLESRAITNLGEKAVSTPKNMDNEMEAKRMQSAATGWCDYPSNLRAMPNFDLPIEMSSSVGMENNLDSPDLLSSLQDDKSAYQALLDPYTGSVALRPTQRSPKTNGRRKIQLPPEEDSCSLDSVSGCSLESEDEPVMPDPGECSEQEDSKRSKSTATASECSDPIPEYSAAEEFRDERSWLQVRHGGGHATCDMKVIEPFKRVISHGGYSGDAAIIVFSACHLPDNARPDYRYVMDNLFLYVIYTLERLVTDEYVLVYLHGSAGRRRLPSFGWLHECYKLIDRRLRKSLKQLYLVHPTFWLKSFVVITKPFVSSKFFRKLNYVKSLKELLEKVQVEPNAIPDIVKHFDAHRR